MIEIKMIVDGMNKFTFLDQTPKCVKICPETEDAYKLGKLDSFKHLCRILIELTQQKLDDIQGEEKNNE